MANQSGASSARSIPLRREPEYWAIQQTGSVDEEEDGEQDREQRRGGAGVKSRALQLLNQQAASSAEVALPTLTASRPFLTASLPASEPVEVSPQSSRLTQPSSGRVAYHVSRTTG